MIDFNCPKCGDLLSVPDSLAGKVETCGTCQNVCIVPQPAATEDPLPRWPPLKLWLQVLIPFGAAAVLLFFLYKEIAHTKRPPTPPSFRPSTRLFQLPPDRNLEPQVMALSIRWKFTPEPGVPEFGTLSWQYQLKNFTWKTRAGTAQVSFRDSDGFEVLAWPSVSFNLAGHDYRDVSESMTMDAQKASRIVDTVVKVERY